MSMFRRSQFLKSVATTAGREAEDDLTPGRAALCSNDVPLQGTSEQLARWTPMKEPTQPNRYIKRLPGGRPMRKPNPRRASLTGTESAC